MGDKERWEERKGGGRRRTRKMERERTHIDSVNKVHVHVRTR